MLSFLVQHGIKNNSLKDNIIRLSFFVFNGIIGSILVSDLIRLFYGTIPEKPYIEYGIAAGIATSPFIYDKFTLMNNKTNNLAMGFGMLIGSILCDVSEENGRKKERHEEHIKRHKGAGHYRDYRGEAAEAELQPHFQSHPHDKDEIKDEIKEMKKEKSASQKIYERRMALYYGSR